MPERPILAQRANAALVGDSPTQRMQFTSLCQENAKEHGRVFHNEGSARESLQGPL